MLYLAAISSLLTIATAQQFIPPPQGLTSLQSQRFPGASISYKETQFCETTPGVKSYSGYVSLPSRLLGDVPDDSYNANFFFWYFESRHDPSNAPTAIYLGGGPGTSSFDGASNFPCNINPDSNSTTLNEFSWNTNVNMLYIDQPVGSGFSYVSTVQGITDLLTGEFTPLQSNQSFKTNLTTVAATMNVHDPTKTANTTQQAARTLWHAAQVWFQE